MYPDVPHPNLYTATAIEELSLSQLRPESRTQEIILCFAPILTIHPRVDTGYRLTIAFLESGEMLESYTVRLIKAKALEEVEFAPHRE